LPSRVVPAGRAKLSVAAAAAGDGVPVNPAIAHRLLLLLAELGSPEAQADVGFHLALGVEPVAPNPRDQLFRQVPALCWCGHRAGLRGWGADCGRARRLRESAAKRCSQLPRQALAGPLTSVGCLPARVPCRRLVPPDVPAALAHYTLAAQAGDPVAQMTLGYRHLLGIDVPRSCQTGGRLPGTWAGGPQPCLF
jgi:TPR repeat protein